MDVKSQQQLKEELEVVYKNMSDSGKVYLEQTRKILDNNVKDVINIYSNEIRNLALISGTIAPFSLALLGTEKLNTNIGILLLGFSLLVINIIIAQFFLKKQSKDNDKKLAHAEISWIFASADLESIEGDKELLDKDSKIPDYIKNTDKVSNFLGLDSMNNNIQIVRSDLRKQNSIVNIIFSAGAVCIVLSVLVNPLLEFIFYFIYV